MELLPLWGVGRGPHLTRGTNRAGLQDQKGANQMFVCKAKPRLTRIRIGRNQDARKECVLGLRSTLTLVVWNRCVYVQF